MRLHPIRGLTSIQGVGDGGIGATCMVYSDDTPILIKGLAWASKAIYGDRVQICDGVADEVEINAALTAIAAIGGTVLLSEGTFHMAATASVPASCMLRGMGWGSILEYNAGGNCITIAGDNAKARDLKVDIVAGAGVGGTRPNCVYAASRTNLELLGLWLVGDETVADDGSTVRQCGIVFSATTYSRILDCVSQDQKRYGITLASDSDHNLISECRVQGNTQHGIYLEESDYNRVCENTVLGNGQQGIHPSACSNNVICGNECSGGGANGMYISSGSSNAVVGNSCRGNGNSGIVVSNDDNNTVTGNICSGNTQHGILIRNGSADNTVSGNMCASNDSGDTGTYDGISLNATSGNLVSENTCKDNDRWGIMVDADSDFNKISMNYTSGNTSGSIRVNNANCAQNQLELNTTEEGAPGDAGTNTRSYGNYDPSADAFVGNVGAAPW